MSPPIATLFNPNGFLSFVPTGTILVAATAASGLGTFTSANSIAADGVMVQNDSAATVYVAFGATGASPTAVAASATESPSAIPIAAGAIVTLTKGSGNNLVAVIAPGGNGNVFFTAGTGA